MIFMRVISDQSKSARKLHHAEEVPIRVSQDDEIASWPISPWITRPPSLPSRSTQPPYRLHKDRNVFCLFCPCAFLALAGRTCSGTLRSDHEVPPVRPSLDSAERSTAHPAKT